MKKFVFLFFISISTKLCCQNIHLLDSISKESIPFVHIYDGSKGVIADANGKFYWQNNIKGDSIFFSCLGYALKKIGKNELKDSLFLVPKEFELNTVFVTNRPLSAEEIMQNVVSNTAQNMDFSFSSSEVFLIQKSFDTILNLDIEIKKSTISKFDQSFSDEIINQIPKIDSSAFYVKSRWLRDSKIIDLSLSLIHI